MHKHLVPLCICMQHDVSQLESTSVEIIEDVSDPTNPSPEKVVSLLIWASPTSNQSKFIPPTKAAEWWDVGGRGNPNIH